MKQRNNEIEESRNNYMMYRKLGKTGLDVSAIGLGCEHLDKKPYEQVKETIDAALGYGANILDVFMPGAEVRGYVAKALGERRRDVFIQGHICSTDVSQQYDISRDLPNVQKYFEDMLRIFGGYIDLGMLFFIDSEQDYKNVFDTEIAGYAERLKRQGDILHIGFSSHNPETAMKAINTGLPEMVMFSVNPAFDMLPSETYVFDHFESGFGAEMFRGVDPGRTRFYKLCEQKQIGITTMKTFGAGKLLSEQQTPFEKPLTVEQCVEYALSRPAVASVLPGCKSGAEVDGVMRYLSCDAAQRDYSRILSGVRNDFAGNCLYCSHCQPCPAGIDIAAAMKCLDVATLGGGAVPPAARAEYIKLEKGGADCVNCGSCESRCPFGVPVMKNMGRAAEIFGR